jgi:hypothetical protein
VSKDNNSEGHTSVPRRRFLAGLGAAGLGTAAGLFGRQTAASASPQVTEGCCDLAYSNINNSYCYNHASYVWYCGGGTPTYPYQCSCCEDYSAGVSGYSCYRV